MRFGARQLDATAAHAEQREAMHQPLLGKCLLHPSPQRSLQNIGEGIGPADQQLGERLPGSGELLLRSIEMLR
jgi:hypothetical protein